MAPVRKGKSGSKAKANAKGKSLNRSGGKSMNRSKDKSLNKSSRSMRSNNTTGSISNSSSSSSLSSSTKNRFKNVTVVMGNKKVVMTAKMVKMMQVLQSSTREMIPKSPFFRLVREITQTHGEFRWNLDALNGLQAALELYLSHLFEDSNKATFHAKRVTLMPPDINLVLMLRGPFDPILNT